MASKFFGEANPLNKSIAFFADSKNSRQYEVCGVYKNVPDNSSLQFDFLITTSIQGDNNWFSFGYSPFVLLQKEIDEIEFNEKTTKIYSSSKLGFDIKFNEYPQS